MYRHVLYLIDCTPETRREATGVAKHLAGVTNCRMTLVAHVTPAPSAEFREKKAAHAEEALKAIKDQFRNCGCYTRTLVLEGEDIAPLLAEEAYAGRDRWNYDLIVLGTHQTRPEIDELPCRGSVADRVAQHTDLPVLILPAR